MNLNEIISLVDRVIGPAGFECLDAEWLPGERILRLYVDCADGINLDGCAAVNGLLADLESLDALITGKYTLEVSSPGIERPLRSKTHFEKHIGSKVQVRLGTKACDRRQGTGKLLAVSSDDKVTIETEHGPWSFPLEHLHKASLVYDWGEHA